MIEKRYPFTVTNSKIIERILDDGHVAINHMVLRQSEALPEHNANANVYMIVARGEATLRLDAEESRAWPAGSILTIPFQTLMNVSNQSEDVLELFVVKVPGLPMPSGT